MLIVEPYSNNALKRLVKQPVMHFIDTGLAAHLAGWSSAQTLEFGAEGGHFFETHVFGEIYKSYANAGLRPPISFFRNNDRKEIDLLLERDGVLYPVEIKQSANPTDSDTRHFSALDPVASDGLPQELKAFRREIGLGSVICMNPGTFPINRRAWAFPAWAI